MKSQSMSDVLSTILFHPLYFLVIESLTEAGRAQKTACKQCPFIRRPRNGCAEWLTGPATSIRLLVHSGREKFWKGSLITVSGDYILKLNLMAEESLQFIAEHVLMPHPCTGWTQMPSTFHGGCRRPRTPLAAASLGASCSCLGFILMKADKGGSWAPAVLLKGQREKKWQQ